MRLGNKEKSLCALHRAQNMRSLEREVTTTTFHHSSSGTNCIIAIIYIIPYFSFHAVATRTPKLVYDLFIFSAINDKTTAAVFDGCCVKFLFLCGGWCDARRLDTHNFTLLLFLLLSRRAVLVDLTGTEITSRVLPHVERRPLRLDGFAGVHNSCN